MDRQVRKAVIKIEEKDREINSLLEELKLLQADTDKEVQYTREKAKA